MVDEQRRDPAGQYTHKIACDACGKVAGENYATDDEVCGGTDGPGFFLCSRPACTSKVPEGPEERRVYYTAQRTKNDAAESKRRARWKAKHPDA